MLPPPRNFLPVLQKLKSAYLVWFDDYARLPKVHRYTIGQHVDDLLVECIELVSEAAFVPGLEKVPCIRVATRKLDTVKLFLLILWEAHSLDKASYLELSVRFDEIGQNLGGWLGSILKPKPESKQNSPEPVAGEK